MWGSVTGYLAPYWRVRYEDGEWEDFTKRQLQAAVALAHATMQNARNLGITSANPVVVQTMSPGVPADFGETYEGQTVRIKNSTGWSRGTLVAYLPRSGKYTFTVRYHGSPATSLETVRLRPGYYTSAATIAEAEDCPMSSWNLLLTTARAQGSSASNEAGGVESSSDDDDDDEEVMDISSDEHDYDTE